MRVGILTIHHVTNYGAVWQAYALSKAIQARGHEVEVIDYRPWIAERRYRTTFLGLVKALLRLRKPPIDRYARYRAFQADIQRYLPLSGSALRNKEDLSRTASSYDAIVAGSDQIWCVGEGSFRGFDPNFFVSFVPSGKVRKISYAASAGNTKSFGEHKDSIAGLLRDFYRISVRDQGTAQLVDELIPIASQNVLDPVFMHDFRELLPSAPETNDLVFFAEHPQRCLSLAVEVARRSGMRLVVLDGRSTAAAIEYPTLRPIEWLRQMSRAKAVVTDYFHGTAVALRFGKPVVAMPAPGKMAKITDLLNKLGLQPLLVTERTVIPTDFLEALADPKGFRSRVDSRLGPLVEASNQFLDAALAPNP